MNSLEKKYRDDTLSSAEFSEFKEMINRESVSAKEKRLAEAWECRDYEMVDDGGLLSSTKKNIDSALKGCNKRKFNWSRLLGIAASVAIVALGTALFKVEKDNTLMEQVETKIETKDGERVSITLPDGTHVDLEENTVISYNPALFEVKERYIAFSGEGYFIVEKDLGKPFIINSEFAGITVTGTQFLFSSHPDSKQVDLILDEGSVTMKSNINGSTCDMVAGQKATLDFQSGKIIITESETNGRKTFRNSSIGFINTPLDQVLDQLSEECGLDIIIKSLPERSSFSGHLSKIKPNESLNILAKIYDLNIIFADGTIVVSKN